MRKRWTLWAAFALIGALVLTACAPDEDPDAVVGLDDQEEPGAVDDGEDPTTDPADDDESPAPDPDGEALRIGFITTMSGAVAASGLGQLHGFELWLELNDNMMAGRQVELITEDDDASPDQGVEAARRLVEQHAVDFIVGPLLANVGLAVGDYLEGVDTPQFYTIPASDQFLRGKPEALYIGGGTAGQSSHPLGEYAATELGYERAVIVCQDYAYGHELCGGLVNPFDDHGGEIVERFYTPLGTADYGPIVGDIQGLDFDVIFNGLVGADSITFQRTLDDFGLGDAPVLGNLNSMDQSIVREVGPSVLGRMSAGPYAEGADNPATVEFVEAYESEHGQPPTATAAGGYHAAVWINAALEELDGEVTGAQEFFDALNAVELEDSVFGPMRVDDNGNVVFGEVLLREVVEREDGAIVNVPVGVLATDVGPTYHYDYEAFLEQPAYSPDYVGEDWPTDCDAFERECPLDE